MFTKIIENINSIVKVISSGSMPELIDIKKYLNLQTKEILLGVKMEIAQVVQEMKDMAAQLDKVQAEVQDHTAAMQDSIAQLEASLQAALQRANTEAPVELLDALAAVKQRLQKLDDLNVDKPLPVVEAPVEPVAPVVVETPVVPAPEVAEEVLATPEVVEPVAEPVVEPVVEATEAPAPAVAVDLTKPEDAPTA